MRAFALTLALSSVALAANASGAPPMRGIVISCPTWGPEWGRPEMDEALADIKALGATWVQIHPYANIGTDGSVDFTPAEQLGFLARAKQKADKAGVQMFLKPHLAYWGRFDWRGAIEFSTEPQWQRFFREYTAFIVDQARFAQAHNVPLFAVGTELERTVHRPEWPHVIAAVRAVYRGQITYAANWDSVGRTPFWKLVDYIGVQAYFPVGRNADVTTAEIEAGWTEHANELASLSATTGKRVIFAEVGYARNKRAAIEPWKPDTDKSADAAALRARLMGVVLAHAEQQTWFAGMFWWKWMPGMRLFGGDFALTDPEAKAALRHAWAPPPANTQGG